MLLAGNGRRRREYVKLAKRIAVFNAIWQGLFQLEPMARERLGTRSGPSRFAKPK
jgi:hypothetical protein